MNGRRLALAGLGKDNSRPPGPSRLSTRNQISCQLIAADLSPPSHEPRPTDREKTGILSVRFPTN